MIVHCNTMQHPLQISGTQQSDRLLAGLIPENLKLDDRSIDELIAYAGTLSKHVRYWDENNTASGDWTRFWESDQTTLFAIIAGNDSESIRIGYRSKELDYYTWKKQEENGSANPGGSSEDAIVALVSDPGFGIYAVAVLIASICEKVPAGHPLKKEIRNMISSTLREPLKQLIRYHKAVDPNAIDKYAAFIGVDDCASSWGLPDNAAFECIDFVLPFEFIDALWKLFLTFYKTLRIILGKVKKAFQASLRTRTDHAPHITLFITFLYLFRYLQNDLNSLTGKHLLFYYQDVLRLQRRRLIPDKVHLVFEIAGNIARHRILKDTAFKGGTDAAGKPMQYSLEDELVLSQAKLVEKKNFYITVTPVMAGQPQKTVAVMLPAADKRDGIEEEWAPGTKAWSPLSGMPVVNRFQYKLDKLRSLRNKTDGIAAAPVFAREMEKAIGSLKKLQPVVGFSISSMAFWSSTGLTRITSLSFDFDNAVNSSVLEKYNVQLSTKAGLITLKPYFREVPNADINPVTGFPSGVQIATRDLEDRVLVNPDADPSLDNAIIRIQGTQKYLIVLGSKFPSVNEVSDNQPPFLRFTLKEPFDIDPDRISSIDVETFFAGSLGAFKNSPQGILSRDIAGLTQFADEVVITQAGLQSLMVRIPELFLRTPALLKFSFSPPAFTNVGFSVRNTDQWIAIDANGKFAAANFAEPKNAKDIPAQFNFTANAHNADGWILFDFTPPTANGSLPLVLSAQQLDIVYKSKPVTIDLTAKAAGWNNIFSYFTSLGEWVEQGATGLAMRATPILEKPEPDVPVTLENLRNYGKALLNGPVIAHGNLFLGFESLVPDQTLSLLFQMAAGTENPDHFAPEVSWSYLRDDKWVGIPPQYILRDSTLGLKQTGIILFQVPGDINNGNHWIEGAGHRTDLFWFRVSAQELPDDDVFVDALPMLKEIFVHSGEAVFMDDNNTEDHLEKGIAAGTISDMRYRDVAVKSVTQPFISFDGRRSEKADLPAYLRRVHERLRHRHRAVTFWDYERIVLEQFPKIAVAKCLTHTRKLLTARPGHVTIAAIPFPKNMTGNRVYYPICSAGLLEQVRLYLVRQNSYFVGRYGDPGFCCCEDGCTCAHHGRLDVINARFEPVRIKVCVRFYEGRDIPFYTKELNEALKRFLAPWAKEDKPLLFGVKISVTRLLRFLESLDYVDVVMGLQVKHFSSRAMSENFEENAGWSTKEEVTPFTAASVLTTYLDRLNEDNPNVIDHEINVIPSHEKCTCTGCTEKEVVVLNPQQQLIDRLREDLRELWIQHPGNIANVIKNFVRLLDDEVNAGVLFGDIPGNPENGEPGVNAYRITKAKVANRIRALQIALSLDRAKPFTEFNVNNPNSNQ